MDTWTIYRITDYNECPPVTSFYDTKRNRYDALEEFRETGKDLSLVEINKVEVRQAKSDLVELLNAVAASPRFADLTPECEDQLYRSYGHLTVVK